MIGDLCDHHSGNGRWLPDHIIIIQAMEMHKRKAIESAQSAADLKLHLEKYHSQIKEVFITIIVIIIIVVIIITIIHLILVPQSEQGGQCIYICEVQHLK